MTLELKDKKMFYFELILNIKMYDIFDFNTSYLKRSFYNE